MSRIDELESLRGIAAASIMVYHLWYPRFLQGWYRVDVFFVLSGFLVTSYVLRRGGETGFWPRFYLGRVLRICPIYFATLFALVLANPYLPKEFAAEGLLQYLTFTQNVQHYWKGEVPEFHWQFYHTWSLAIEMQYYVLWPVLAWILGRRGIVWVAPPLIALAALARACGLHPHVLLGRCDGHLLGALLAVFLADRAALRHRIAGYRLGFCGIGGIGVGILLLVNLGGTPAPASGGVPLPVHESLTILSGAVIYTCLVGFLVTHAGHPRLQILRSRPFRELGAISYGVYLFHPIIFKGVEVMAAWCSVTQTLLVQVVMVVASLTAASLSWRYVERPILKWRDPLLELFSQGVTRRIAAMCRL